MPDTASTTPDPVAARLAEMERLAACLLPLRGLNGPRKPGLMAEQVAEFVPPLLAAVEAVLKLHARRDDPARTHNVCMMHARQRPRAAFLPEWRKAVDACPDCTVTEKYVCAHCRHECPDADEWPCPTYRAIAAALTGEKAGDEYR